MTLKTEWLWTMKKPQVPLAQGLHEIGIPLMQKNLEIDIDLPIKHVNGDIYFGKKEVNEISNVLKERMSKDITYTDKIYVKINNTIAKLKKKVASLEKLDPKHLTNEQLIHKFIEGYSLVGELTAFMSFKGTVQISDILEEKVRIMLRTHIKDIEEQNNVFLLVSLPKEESIIQQEQKSMLNIAILKEKGKDIKKHLTEHTKKFGWMNCVMYQGLPYTEIYFRNELKSLQKENCLNKLKKIEEKKEEREHLINEQIKKLQLNVTEKKIFSCFRNWVHIRTYVKEMTSYGMAPTIPFLREMAKRVKWSYTNLLYLSYNELQNIFAQKHNMLSKLLKESRLRQKGWGFVVIKGKAKYYNFETLKEIEEKENIDIKGVKGFSACNGIVKGYAIIVNNIDDIDNVKERDILITHMTTTNYVPVLSKVSAIVTDEGGISCHAAIISREFNIPCIIGTRIATKAFKTGDYLEVNANKGVVRKLR